MNRKRDDVGNDIVPFLFSHLGSIPQWVPTESTHANKYVIMKPLMASNDVDEPALFGEDGHAITNEDFGETEAEPAHQ